MSEARTGKRFPMQLPIRISKPDSTVKVNAITHDLSAAGVYIQAKAAFKLGTRISFDITLPAATVGAPQDVRIHCDGRVVRVDAKNGKRRGVACVIDRYKFVRARERRT